ncbi:MAG: hypothetical protein SF029_12470 [bacterium]|nr:hypothetical protein [bacterium]
MTAAEVQDWSKQDRSPWSVPVGEEHFTVMTLSSGATITKLLLEC